MKASFLEILERLGGESRIHYSLDHFTEALAAAGSPEKSVNTIVISGTNGKGTVSLLVSAALAEAGHSVTTFLSPHLQHPRERFLHNLQSAPWEALEPIAARYAALAEEHRLTYFEFLTLVYFVWARELGAQVQVLEVGMGGRLDATNVTQPLATVLTPIDWDHQKFLGNSLEAILEEKMGIFRPGVPVFTSVNQPPLMERLEARCRKQGSAFAYAWRLQREILESDWAGQRVRIDGHEFTLTNPTPATVENATLAYQTLRSAFPQIPTETIQRAFARVVTPGRMETVQENPRVVLSGDHNPAGMECLVAALKRLKTRPRIVCAFSPDKPYKGLIHRLHEVSDDIVLTVIPRFAEAMPPDYRDCAAFIADPQEAVEAVLRRCAPSDTLVVTGSLYLVGELRPRWRPDVRFLR